MDDIDRIVEGARADFQACADPAALENAKAKYLGKTGTLTARLKSLGSLAPGERAAAGARINAAKATLEEALVARGYELVDTWENASDFRKDLPFTAATRIRWLGHYLRLRDGA